MPHTMRIPLFALAAAGLLACTGCQTFQEMADAARRVDDVQTIDDNLYSVAVYIPNESRQVAVRDAAFNRAKDYCSAKDMGAQLLDATSEKADGGGARAQVVFRCVHYMKAPETFDDDDK